MLINKKAIRDYVNNTGTKIGKDAFIAIDRKLTNLLDRAIKGLNGRKIINDQDILSKEC